MENRNEILLAEAKMYKELNVRSIFSLTCFAKRLALSDNEQLKAYAEQLCEGTDVLENISALLEKAAKELESLPCTEEASETQSPVSDIAEEVSEEAAVETPVSCFGAEPESGLFDNASDPDAVFGFAGKAPVFDFIGDASDAPVALSAEGADSEAALSQEAAEGNGMKKCENCGALIKDTYVFCSICGSRVSKVEKAVHESSFADFLEADPVLSQRVFPAFDDIAEENVLSDADFTASVRRAPVKEEAYVNNARPAAFLVYHKDNSLIPVIKDEFIIGRDSAKTDFCIADNSAISRVHAKISFVNGQYFICDCNSVNGTFVNETRIMPADSFILFNGSEIRLNTERFTFRLSY